MAFQITGKIEVIGTTTPISTKSGSVIYRREFVLDATRYNPENGEPWENHPKFELGGNNVNIIDQFQVGQRVTVDFFLNGAKYPDQATGEIKYFTTIKAFRITAAEQQGQRPAQAPYQGQPAYPPQQQNPFPATAPTGQPFPPAVDQDGNPVENTDDLLF